jgi:hypothetical protein
LILHVFYVEGEECSFIEPFDREIEPSSVLVFDVVDSDPKVVLHQATSTLAELTFSAL